MAVKRKTLTNKQRLQKILKTNQIKLEKNVTRILSSKVCKRSCLKQLRQCINNGNDGEYCNNAYGNCLSGCDNHALKEYEKVLKQSFKTMQKDITKFTTN